MCSVFEEFPKGWGVKKIPRKWKILGGGGVLCEIPSVVGVWIFSGTTHSKGLTKKEYNTCDYTACMVQIFFGLKIFKPA